MKQKKNRDMTTANSREKYTLNLCTLGPPTVYWPIFSPDLNGKKDSLVLFFWPSNFFFLLVNVPWEFGKSCCCSGNIRLKDDACLARHLFHRIAARSWYSSTYTQL